MMNIKLARMKNKPGLGGVLCKLILTNTISLPLQILAKNCAFAVLCNLLQDQYSQPVWG